MTFARIDRARGKLGDDVAVDLAVDDAHRGLLHDGALVTLRSEHVEPGLANEVVPFGQRRGRLGQIVGTRRDQAVDATSDRLRTAAAGDEEGSLVALDDRFGRHGLTEKRLTRLERGDELVAILDLESSVRHSGLLCENCGFSREGRFADRLDGATWEPPGSQRLGRYGCPPTGVACCRGGKSRADNAGCGLIAFFCQA
jgi:hypothetical protein